MFVKTLKKLRNENKVSQSELAKHLLVSQQAVAKWETERSTPDPEMLRKIAAFFNVSVDYLLGNTIVRNYPEQVALHSNFDNLPEEAIKEIESHIAWVKEKYKDK